jgi:predicted dehydrogenase
MAHPDQHRSVRLPAGAPSAPPPVSGRPLRVGVVGTRTVSQGIGSYVARAFASAGCEVAAFVGTRSETVEQARAELARRFGLECRGYLDVESMLAGQPLDAIAICSPPAAHRAALAAALEARVHVLCEKPLWWEADSARRPDLQAQVESLASAFLERGRLLALNAQWPATLSAYRRLHPRAEEGGVRRFAMRLSPRGETPGRGHARQRRERLVVDAAPHALSLLQALAGHGSVEDATASEPATGATHGDASLGGGPGSPTAALAALDLRFTWATPAGRTEVELELRQCPEQPRPAGYAINGQWADREVELTGYSMALVSRERPARRVPLDDPLDLHVADFVAGIAAGRRTDVEALVESLGALRDLVGVAAGPEEAA